MPARQTDLASLVTDFATRLAAAVEAATTERVRAAILSGLDGGSVRRGPGRPRKNPVALGILSTPPRRKRPKQFCPVPGCKNVAAPVFGMVCSKHKDIPKAKIKQYRDARKAKQKRA